MSRYARSKEATDARKPTIGVLPADIIHRILELMPIRDAAKTSTLSKHWRQMWTTQTHLVFDHQFFDYVDKLYDDVASAARIIHKILMQHSGPILGFHLISGDDGMTQSDIDQCIIFVSKHNIQMLTMDLFNLNMCKLPYGIMHCSSLTHLKLCRGVFKPSDCIKFPNLVSLHLEFEQFANSLLQDTFILPKPELLKLSGVDYVRPMASPRLENLSFFGFSRVSIICFQSIKNLCLDGSSLQALAKSYQVPERLVQPLKLQSLKIYDLKISVEHVLYILSSSYFA